MRRLLDTNICIYLIKQKPPEVLQTFKQFAVGDIAISAITVAELAFGASKSKQQARNQAALSQFLAPLIVVPFDAGAAQIYGKVRAWLESQGTPIGALDLLIAAQALHLNLPLVTNNTKEFERIPDLKVENWVGG